MPSNSHTHDLWHIGCVAGCVVGCVAGYVAEFFRMDEMEVAEAFAYPRVMAYRVCCRVCAGCVLQGVCCRPRVMAYRVCCSVSVAGCVLQG